jgi:CRISPR-associated protein Cas1
MVKGSKTLKIILDHYGSFLGMEKGCFIVKDKEGNINKYPLFENEIGEVILKSGNMVSVGALASLGFWNIDVLILTQKGNPVAMLRGLDDDSHVETRVAQYKALENGKGNQIAKQIVYAKLKGQNIILRKYGLRQHDLFSMKTRIEDKDVSRQSLLTIEGHATESYFQQIFQLLPKQIRINKRETYKAYGAINNLFNLAYTMLKWKVFIAINKAKLEPYLGFIHSLQYGKPSLVCDLVELYRYLMDDYVIQFCLSLGKKDFITKTEQFSSNRIGKREYLNDNKTMNLMRDLTQYFEKKVDIERIKHGKKQSIETLIYEEALLLAKYLRNERALWIPRTPTV